MEDRRTFEEVKAEADHAVARETADSVITYRGNGGSDDHTINLAAAYLNLTEGPLTPGDTDLERRLDAHVDRWSRGMKAKLWVRQSWGENWLEGSVVRLLALMREEVAQLEIAIGMGASEEDVREEAADVSNLANMVADAYARDTKAGS